MKQRVQTAIILLIIFIPVLFFNDFFLLAVLPFLSCLTMYEILKASKQKTSIFMSFILMLAPLTFVISYFYKPLTQIHILIIILFILIINYIINRKMKISQMAFLFLMITFIGLALVGAIQVRSFGRATFLYLIIATFFTDIGAFLVGVTFGKTKLIEYVSPKKTVEGSIGGIIFSMAASIAFALYLKVPFSIVFIVLCSVLLSIFAQIGDLFFSALKREMGIKDFSNILPGHGGVLDRFDSLLTNIIVFSFLLSFTTFF